MLRGFALGVAITTGVWLALALSAIGASVKAAFGEDDTPGDDPTDLIQEYPHA